MINPPTSAGGCAEDRLAESSWMREHRRPAAWIERSLARLSGEIITPTVAHAIGESFEPDTDSALGEFLVYDILRPRQVLAELDSLTPTSTRRHWVAALAAFVTDALCRGWSDGRDRTDEPIPMLYVTRRGVQQGAWVIMTESEEQVADHLAGLPGDRRNEDWQVHARMGFYDVYPLQQPEIAVMNHIGQGIARYGEAYAAYAEHSMQTQLSSHEFEARYLGSVGHLDEFVFQVAEQRGWLAAINELNETHGLHGLVRIDVDQLRSQLFSQGYAAERGRRVFHLFGPTH